MTIRRSSNSRLPRDFEMNRYSTAVWVPEGVDWGSEWSISIFPTVPCSQMQTRNHQNSLRRVSSVCRLICLHTSCMIHEFLSDFREFAVSSPILDMIKRKYGEMTVP